jgi:flagellar hook-associated protein 3 FlgL
MRVTPQMVSQQFIKNTQKNNVELAKIQQQIASGRKFDKISENPTDALKGLSNRSSLMQIEQYQKNIQDGSDWLTATDDALGSTTGVLQRVRELMVQASNDTNSDNEKKNIFANEIRSLKEQLVNIANTTFGDRYIFSGVDTTSAPFQNGTLNNVGESEMVWNIGQGQSKKINISSDTVFGFEVDGQNLFDSLDSIIQDLENGDNPNSLLSNIDKQMDNLLTQRTIVGTNQNTLELAANKLDQANFLTQKMWSEKEGTDVAKAYMELTAHETTLKASLTAGSKIMTITLADFLR